MLNIALWILAAYLTVSACVVWFNTQPDTSYFNLGMTGYEKDTTASDLNKYQSASCIMTSWFEAPVYAWCFIGKVTSPIFDLVDWVWNLLTGWTQLMHAIFVSVPAGDLFEAILTPLLAIIELGAVIVILLRLAAIIRGSG